MERKKLEKRSKVSRIETRAVLNDRVCNFYLLDLCSVRIAVIKPEPKKSVRIVTNNKNDLHSACASEIRKAHHSLSTFMIELYALSAKQTITEILKRTAFNAFFFYGVPCKIGNLIWSYKCK